MFCLTDFVSLNILSITTTFSVALIFIRTAKAHYISYDSSILRWGTRLSQCQLSPRAKSYPTENYLENIFESFTLGILAIQEISNKRNSCILVLNFHILSFMKLFKRLGIMNAVCHQNASAHCIILFTLTRSYILNFHEMFT